MSKPPIRLADVSESANHWTVEEALAYAQGVADNFDQVVVVLRKNKGQDVDHLELISAKTRNATEELGMLYQAMDYVMQDIREGEGERDSSY